MFLEGWLTQLDRSRFELIGFHTGRTSDACTEARRRLVRPLRAQALPSSTAWRQAVTDASPHVLLYPEVGMDPIAGRLAAQRLAPVQCVAWGQPETTGMPTLDYFLSSDLMEPLDGAAHYTESLVRLPNLGLCFLPDALPDVRLDRAALGLPPDLPVYWSGQALYKYLPQYDAIFPRIAKAVGACRFVFIGFAKSKAVTAAFRERLGRAFAAAGLDAEAILRGAAADVARAFRRGGGRGGRGAGYAWLVRREIYAGLPGAGPGDRDASRPIHAWDGTPRRSCDASAARRRSPDRWTIMWRSPRGWDATPRGVRRSGRRWHMARPRAFRDMEYMRALEAFLADAVARA